jgi:hypothetical protein
MRTSFSTPELQPSRDVVPGLSSRQLMFFYIQAVLKPTARAMLSTQPQQNRDQAICREQVRDSAELHVLVTRSLG